MDDLTGGRLTRRQVLASGAPLVAAPAWAAGGIGDVAGGTGDAAPARSQDHTAELARLRSLVKFRGDGASPTSLETVDTLSRIVSERGIAPDNYSRGGVSGLVQQCTIGPETLEAAAA